MLGRTATLHTLDKLSFALLFGGLAAAPVLLFPLLGSGVAPTPTIFGVLLLVAVGWLVPDVVVRSRATATHHAWAQALTVYVDIVGISLAGGAGVEDALMVAAGAGSGPHFEGARCLRSGRPRHAGGEACGTPSTSSAGPAGHRRPPRSWPRRWSWPAESGSTDPRDTRRPRRAAHAHPAADRGRGRGAASRPETMGIAPALMAVAAVVLIGYPAVARFFE